MYSVRCLCGKIVCQADHIYELPKVEEAPQPSKDPAIVILCRHCKRYVIISVPAITSIHFASNVVQPRSGKVFTSQ